MIRGMKHLPYKEKLRSEIVQLGVEKALGRYYCGLSVLERADTIDEDRLIKNRVL